MVKHEFQMSDQEPTPESNDGKWHAGLKIGIGLSIFWLGAGAIYMLQDWSEFKELKPDAVGNFSAGLCAALAFLWLVVATFLQMEELKLQRRELRSSRIAAQQQASETEALVAQNSAAVAVAKSTLAEQQKRWKEEQLDKLIDSIGARTRLSSDDFIMKRGVHSTVHAFYVTSDKLDGDTHIRRTLKQLRNVMPFEPQDKPAEPDRARESAEAIVRAINAIEEEIVSFRSVELKEPFPAVQARIDLVELYEFRDQLMQLLMWLRYI